MRWILFLFAGLAFLDGLVTYTTATTIFQQIVGLMAFIVSTLFFSGAAVVDALVGVRNEIRKISGPAEAVSRLRGRVMAESKPLGSGT